MIRADIRLEGDGSDLFDGPCELPAVPPLGAHVRVMDRHANIRELVVQAVMFEAVSIKLNAETPGGIATANRPLRIDLICSEIV